MKKNAFTMIEMVFVIVVLGILAAVAVPKFSATRVDAQITKARSDVASIRSAIINERQSRLFRGQPAFITRLDDFANSGMIFDGNGTNTLLQYPIRPSNANGHWNRRAVNQYDFIVNGNIGTAAFIYNPAAGVFDCNGNANNTGTACAKLTQ